DPALRAALARAALAAPTTTPVLVSGESGTGKELLARALHELGPNPAGPFVAVNCGALPRELQPKLLRVLESGRLRRVGGSGEVSARVRIVAMTLRDLEGEVRCRSF